jgi:hypothetical protein
LAISRSGTWADEKAGIAPARIFTAVLRFTI